MVANSLHLARSQGRSVLKVVLAVVLAIEEVFVVLVAGMTAIDGPSAFGWRVAAIAFVPLAIVAGILGIAVVALWQSGWGRDELLGPVRRGGVVAAASAHVAFGLYNIARGWLWPFSGVPDVSGSSDKATVLFVIAALIVVAFPPARWPAPKATLAFACAAALAFPVVDLATQAVAHRIWDEVSQHWPAFTSPVRR